MIAGLLLAAGAGRRWGGCKALVPWHGEALVRRAVRELLGSQIDELVVVTGAERERVDFELSSFPGRFRQTWNSKYDAGLLGSIQAGLMAVGPKVDAVLVTLVDLPYLQSVDFDRVLGAAKMPPSERLLRSRYFSEPGHPVFIGSKYFPEILTRSPADRGCAFLFEEYSDRVEWVDQDGPQGHMDIDKPEDSNAHITQ